MSNCESNLIGGHSTRFRIGPGPLEEVFDIDVVRCRRFSKRRHVSQDLSANV